MFQEVTPSTYPLFLKNQSAVIPPSDATGDDEYHVFAAASDSVSGDNEKYGVHIEIPIPPGLFQLIGYINKETLDADLVAYMKFPLFPAVKVGEFKGNLLTGITIPVNTYNLHGTVTLFAKEQALWIRFDLIIFGRHRIGTFKIMPLPFAETNGKEYEHSTLNVDAI